MNSQENVTLKRTLRDGRVTSEVLPRYIAELVIACIPHDEPQTASAVIVAHRAPEVNPHASYAIKATTPARAANVALALAGYMTARLVA